MYASTFLLAFAVAVSATPTFPIGNGNGNGNVVGNVGDVCGNNNKVHCCDSESADAAVGGLLGGVNLSNLLSGCNDITATVIGAAVPIKNACKLQAVCCGETRQAGLVNLGCTPLNVL
ncbi:hypothetical protein PWT90_02446 [Aphanocladium album]|nr:hypothetical protein PWT90_02446 [Aphanocladium album]